jgi:small subunit ribosomal protein S1
VDDPESFIGTTHQFRITQLRRGGEDVVVSRRAVLEADRREEAAAVRATLIEGAVMLGRVSGLARFGAFVDLGAGVTGLVHITELSHGRINSVDQAVHVGEPVRVKILKLQGEHDRISLSIRQASEDPWVGVEAAFKSAQVVPGKVLRLADFGAFVELAPGVEALAPASEFPPRVGGWKDSLPVGSRQRWRVLKVDTAQRRISVTIAGEENEQVLAELTPGVELKGRVQRVEKFGVFVWLGPGRVGLMPNVLTGTPPGTDLASRFPIAEDVDVEVVGVDEAGKIRLALKGAAQRRERTARAEPRGDFPRRRGPKAKSERVPDASFTDSSAGFGSLLADKLKDALG